MALNSGAIPENRRCELFGHKGILHRSDAGQKIPFEAADGGTIPLDELGELPLEMQVKYFRVLQSGEIQELRDTIGERKVDVRSIAATNRTLSEEVKAGRLRRPLYRLAVIPIRLL